MFCVFNIGQSSAQKLDEAGTVAAEATKIEDLIDANQAAKAEPVAGAVSGSTCRTERDC